jgi:2-polyprenyl-6-methoxyphenol hydroxylase-like FAD-dependent oxidoreductase
MTSSDTPVVIAGAGPVGLALALALAGQGVPNVVLEARGGLSRHSRAPGVLSRTLEAFAAWGVRDQAMSAGTLLTRPQVWVVGRARPVLTIDLSPLGEMTAVSGILVLPQNRTEQILLEAARASGLAEVRFGHRVTGFEQDEIGVTVAVEGPGGAPTRVRGEYLVGCDGAHSAVREALGWSLEGTTYPARLLLADIAPGDQRDMLPWPRVTETAGAGALGGLRIEPGVWRLIATLDPRMTDEAAASRAHVTALVDALLGPGPFDLVWSSVFTIHCRTSPRFRDRRVLLAGDAAHINSPAGGQGMNSGIQDAHNLAWKLAAARRGDPEALLQSYEAERRPAILTNVDRYTDLLTRGVLLAPHAVRLGVLGIARLLLAQPLLTRRLLRRAGMLDTRYRDSPIISGRGAWLGARAPDARLTRRGQPLRLHDLVARDAALLLFDDGRLPAWNVAQAQRCVGAIDTLHVLRIVRRATEAGADDLVDARGDAWRGWATRHGVAALVRPDGHVGWMAERPTPDELRRGVRRALGVT